MANLEKIIKIYRETVKIIPPNNLYRVIYLTNFGNVLNYKFLKIGNTANLDTAKQIFIVFFR